MREFYFIDKEREQFGGDKNLEKFMATGKGLEFHSVITSTLVFIHSCTYSQIMYYVPGTAYDIGGKEQKKTLCPG